MKIDRIEVWKESFELVRPYTIAFRTISHVHNIIVKLSAGTQIGLGAASPESFVTGETLQATEAALTPERLDFLKGSTFESGLPKVGEQLKATPAARAAVDIALHDLHARTLGKSLVDFLGKQHETLPTSITIGIKGIAETLEEADEYLQRGFTVLKVKLGKVMQEDLERVKKLRERFGTSCVIRLDMNQGYTSDELLQFWKETSDCDVEFIEQPLPAGDIAGMRAVPQAIRNKIAADESLLSPEDARALVTPFPAAGIFNIKLMKCGGVAPAREIAAVAQNSGVNLMWGCMDESRISISAALHTAFSCAATRYLDLDGSLDLGRDLVEGGFEIEAGKMRLIEGTGLGVTLL